MSEYWGTIPECTGPANNGYCIDRRKLGNRLNFTDECKLYEECLATKPREKTECKMTIEKCLDCKIVIKRGPETGLKPINGKFMPCNCGFCGTEYYLVCPLTFEHIEITKCIKEA